MLGAEGAARQGFGAPITGAVGYCRTRLNHESHAIGRDSPSMSSISCGAGKGDDQIG